MNILKIYFAKTKLNMTNKSGDFTSTNYMKYIYVWWKKFIVILEEFCYNLIKGRGVVERSDLFTIRFIKNWILTFKLAYFINLVLEIFSFHVFDMRIFDLEVFEVDLFGVFVQFSIHILSTNDVGWLFNYSSSVFYFWMRAHKRTTYIIYLIEMRMTPMMSSCSIFS